MKLIEIKTLNQLQIELVKNGFSKTGNDPFEYEQTIPGSGEFAITYMAQDMEPPKLERIEPRTEIQVNPRINAIFNDRHTDVKGRVFLLSAYGYPNVESLRQPEISFNWPKWEWGEADKVKDNYPAGKILDWKIYETFTSSTINLSGYEIDMDNFEADIGGFMGSYFTSLGV